MAFNPYNEKDLGRLRQSISSNARRWDAHLSHRMAFMRQVAGFHFGPDRESCPDHVVYPLMGLMLKIFSRLISANEPRAHVEHWDPDYDVHCHELKLSLDDEFERIDLAGTLSAATVESFFLSGWIRVGRVDRGGIEEVSGYYRDAGGTFADPILSEDMILDLHSKRWKSIGYVGDWARVPTEWIQENKRFDKKARQLIQPTRENLSTPLLGSMRRVRSQVLSTGSTQQLDAEFEDHSDIGTLYFPRENRVLMIDRNIKNVLSWEEFEGPDRPTGMYHRLGYNYLPGNIIPLPPLAEVMDQHLLANELANKAAALAKNQKQLLLVTGKNGREDGNAIQRGENFDTVFVNDPKGISEAKFNGPDQGLWTMAGLLRESFMHDAGNLQSTGGLAPSSGTVGQDRLLADSASRQVQDMQADVTKLTTDVMEDIDWYVRRDPTWKRRLVKTIENTSIRIPFMSQPAMLPGEFEDYRIQIEPYNARSRTPLDRAAALKADLKEFVLPLMPLFEGSGMKLNPEYLFKRLAELQGDPDLAGLFQYTQGEQERPAGPRGSKPAETKRTYERINRPQSTLAGRNKVMQAMAMGSRSQPKEQAMLLR